MRARRISGLRPSAKGGHGHDLAAGICLLCGIAAVMAIGCQRQTIRSAVVFSDDGGFPVQDKPVAESRFEANPQPALEGYAGVYLNAQTTGDDDGYDQWIAIEISAGKATATYSWKSWNDNPSVEPASGSIRDVSIADNVFYGCQDVHGGSRACVQGRFMAVTLCGRRYEGILESGTEGRFWTKQALSVP